jgi:hypothetical protein
VELLVHQPERLSRNRNFHAFDQPGLRRARRIARQLRAVRDRLIALPDGAFRLIRIDDRVELTMTDPTQNLTQVSYLSREEWDILCQDPRVASLDELSS